MVSGTVRRRQSEVDVVVEEEVPFKSHESTISLNAPRIGSNLLIEGIPTAIPHAGKLYLSGWIQHGSHLLQPRRHEFCKMPTTCWHGSKILQKVCCEIPDIARLDAVRPVLQSDLDEEHACECRHAMQVGAYPDHYVGYSGVTKHEVDRRYSGADSLVGAILVVMWDGFSGRKAAEDVGVEMKLRKLEV